MKHKSKLALACVDLRVGLANKRLVFFPFFFFTRNQGQPPLITSHMSDIVKALKKSHHNNIFLV